MRINHNIAALNTYRQLGSANNAQQSSMEKLSSGLRINRAGDDAAGLAISEKMRGQIRGLEQAQTNAQDGISMIQTAEGALNETHAILQRMRELATQASNDTNTDTDRGEIQKEINQLTSEINRIGNTTEFNTQKLLNGGAEKTEVTVTNSVPAENPAGNAEKAAQITIGDLTFEAKTAGVAGNDLQIEIVQGTGTNTATSATKVGDKITVTLGTDGTDAADPTKATATAIKNAIESDPTSTAAVSVTIAEGKDAATQSVVTATNLTGGLDESADYNAGTPGEFTFTATAPQDGQSYYVDGKELTLAPIAEDASAEDIGNAIRDAINADNELKVKYTATSDAEGVVTLTQNVASETAEAPVIETGESGATGKFSASFQVGANEGQSMSISIADMRSEALGIAGTKETTVSTEKGTAVFTKENTVTDGTDNSTVEAALDVSSHENASAAITVINKAIESVSSQRSELGAYQNRLDHTINNLGTSAENLTAAESRIRDVDMAKEMMEQTKASILSQASQAMLAQANQMPQGVLQLLR